MSEQTTTRNTAQRNVVLESVYSLGGTHPTSAEVLKEAKKNHPSISRATVYRNLDVLAEEGKILRVEMTQGPVRYDHTLIPHSHAICRLCDKVFDIAIDGLNGEVEKLIGKESASFHIEGYSISFEGICRECSGA